MAFKINVNTEDGYVLVRQYGDTDLDEYIESGEKALQVALNNQIMNVLIDVTGITSPASIIDLFTSTKHHAEASEIKPKAAIFGRQDQKRELDFIESVGINRGMPIRGFTDRNEALAWLLKSASL